jgi:hypothetical protein
MMAIIRRALAGRDRKAHLMSFWKKLFGSSPVEEAEVAQGAPEEYKGFTIRAAPYKFDGQFQTSGVVEKEIDGVRKEHKFIRADRHASYDDAVAFSLSKARQLVDEQGDQMFKGR